MLCGGCPTRVSKETPAASCSALPQTGDRIGSSLRLASRQSSWLRRADVAVGSFTSFALPRRVRFAARAELPQRHHSLVILDLVARGIGSDRLGNEARRQVAVMLLDHAGVAVAEIARQD